MATSDQYIALIDEALGLAPGTRADHVERVRALNTLMAQLAAAEKRIQELETLLEPADDSAEAAE